MSGARILKDQRLIRLISVKFGAAKRQNNQVQELGWLWRVSPSMTTAADNAATLDDHRFTLDFHQNTIGGESLCAGLMYRKCGSSRCFRE
jgi:hypothetical protein